MDRSEGRDEGKTDGTPGSSMCPERVGWRDRGKEATEEMEGMTVGGKSCCPYVRGTTRLACKSRRSYNLPSLHSLILLFSLFIILFHHPHHTIGPRPLTQFRHGFLFLS